MELHAAASRGDTNGVTSALGKGADINARNSVGQTALVFALERAKAFSRRCGPSVTLETVDALLDAGATLEEADNLGATAVHHAAAIANPEFLALLRRTGAKTTHLTKSGYSVLLHACFQPSSTAKRGIITELQQAGASLDAMSEYGEFPLGVCLHFGDFETLRQLIALGANPEPLNWTLLHHAIAFEEPAAVEEMSPSAATINTPNHRFLLSPWLLAFIRGNLDSIRYLAEKGADLTQVARCAESPLHLAAEFGHEAVLRWLLDFGANSDAQNQFGETPLHHATEWNRIGCAKILLEHGADAAKGIHVAHSREAFELLVQTAAADINAVDPCGSWPLKSAAEDNDTDRIAWLLRCGAEVDRTSTGETALHAAVRFDSREAVRALLTAGANPNAQDVDGWTPLFGALSSEVIRDLRKAGASSRITDDVDYGPERWLGDPLLVQALRETI